MFTRGTHVVLKRLLFIALGALGLGALAAGSAFAQSESNIPAPDGFDDHLECAANAADRMVYTPTVKQGEEETVALDDLLMGTDGYMKIDKDDGKYGRLTQMFPTTVSCGGATNLKATSKSYKLAEGYMEVYDAYKDRNTKKERYDSAVKNEFSASTINAREKLYLDAQKKLVELSEGTIYMAGIAEWDAMREVTDAIDEWDDVMGDLPTVTTADRDVGFLIRKDDLDGSEFFSVDVNSDGDFEDDGDIIGYYDITVSTYDATTGAYTEVADNFDDSTGNFTKPDAPAAGAGGTITDIRTDLTAVDAEIEKINDALGKTTNTARRAVLEGYLEKSEAEKAHINAELTRALEDTTTRGPEGSTYNIAERNRLYEAQVTLKEQAKTNLEDAVETRVGKTTEVKKAFTSAKAILEQDYLRKQYLVDNLDEDASDKATATAEEARDDAKDLRDEFRSYSDSSDAEFQVENPAGELLDALLTPSTSGTETVAVTDDDGAELSNQNVEIPTKTDGGDDGNALVSAISSVHGNTVVNKSEIEKLNEKLNDADGNPIDLKNLENQVEMLTGDDEEGGGIEELTTRLDMLYTVDDPETVDVDESGGQVTTNTGNITTNTGNITTNTGNITTNTGNITTNTGNIKANTDDLDQAWMDIYGTERGVEGQHTNLDACAEGALVSLSNMAACADARSKHNATDIKDNATDIETLGEDVIANETAIAKETADRKAEDAVIRGEFAAADDMVRGEFAAADKMEMDARMAEDAAIRGEFATADDMVRGEFAAADKMEMDARMAEDTALGGRIDAEAATRGEMDMTLATAIAAEATTRGEMDMTLATAIAAEATTRASADMGLSDRIDGNAGDISTNADAIAANMRSIGSNASAIGDNRNMIGELSDDLDVVRAGVAASMALAGMPAVNGRGIAIGVGSFDGESAFAVGFQIRGEQASFQVGVTSSGGATGASAGVGFNF